MCVGMDGNELNTSALKSIYGKAVTVDCSPARLYELSLNIILFDNFIKYHN